MKTVGIIAEFNPFHNGHAYLLGEAVRKSGADHCIVVMSGSFVQRGAPACSSKYDRARCALENGADAVFELPVSYATASAETFAHGGVSALDALGVTDTIAFGAETDDIDELIRCARTLADPPEEYTARLGELLKEGHSYPSARAAALPEYAQILSSPNNILAVEYLKALERLGSDVTPVAVGRTGAGHHDDVICEFASATAIRNALSSGPDNIREAVPDITYRLLSEGYGHTLPVGPDDMTQLAHYMLLTRSADELAVYQDMNRDIANRFLSKAAGSGSSLSDLIRDNRTRELTYTRLSRALLHCILGLKDLTRSPEGDLIPCPYVRLLGYRREASQLMHEIAASSRIPVINKAARAAQILSPEALEMFEATVRADRIYDLLVNTKYGTRLTDGYRISPVII